MIEINNLTKRYGHKKGIFDLSLKVEKGEVFGFLGPNGAGKTTTIRNLMGFIKPDSGNCLINGLDCRNFSSDIQNTLGYLPGEISFIDDMEGMEFIKFIGKMKGINDFSRVNKIIDMFSLNPCGKIKKMSKGMKQKIGIVCAFMHNPDVLILDEPTSGLDPLMQNKFIELILFEKNNGKTIFMSSHIFEEVERCCDRIAVIKDGALIAMNKMENLRNSKRKSYVIIFKSASDAVRFAKSGLDVVIDGNGTRATVSISGSPNELINELSGKEIISLDVNTQTLEELFMNYYAGEDKRND